MSASAESKTYVIAGGGLAGLFAARVLRTLGANKIYIIEKAPRVGGLLQSVNVSNPLGNGEDFSFDYGTHFVLTQKDSKINGIIEQDIDQQKYTQFDNSLQEGHYYNGALYDASGCLDVRNLEKQKTETIFKEIEKLVDEKTTAASNAKGLHDVCVKRYGETATAQILKDIYKKLTGMPMQDLSLSMEDKLFSSRLILTDREKAIALKKNPAWDWRIAFADCNDSKSNITKFYPKKGGIGVWLDTMAKNLKEEGVEIITERSITALDSGDGKSKPCVTLSDGKKISCDMLIWCLPAILLALMTKTTVPSSKPEMRSVSVMHFITDQKPVSRPYWITNLDQNFLSYRTTLYDNFSPSLSSFYRGTVEILGKEPIVDTEESKQKIFNELKTTNIIPTESKMLWCNIAHKAGGFPILKPGASETYDDQMNILEKAFPYVYFAGNRSGGGHGQIPIMGNVHETLVKAVAG